MPKQLLADERLMLPPLHRHWILLVRGMVPAGLTMAAFVLVADVAARGLVPADIRLLATVAAAAFLGLWAIVVWLRWTEDALTVTDQRVILEEGVLQRTSRVIPLDRVQDVSTTQTLLGRILGYGSVEIDAAGASGAERFAYVAAPELLRDQVFVLTERRKRQARP
jgi:uncharacterized membrane protein YdbT with pleckstrin-like domain